MSPTGLLGRRERNKAEKRRRIAEAAAALFAVTRAAGFTVALTVPVDTTTEPTAGGARGDGPPPGDGGRP